jgi:hypothetical protein
VSSRRSGADRGVDAGSRVQFFACGLSRSYRRTVPYVPPQWLGAVCPCSQPRGRLLAKLNVRRKQRASGEGVRRQDVITPLADCFTYIYFQLNISITCYLLHIYTDLHSKYLVGYRTIGKWIKPKCKSTTRLDPRPAPTKC